MPTDSGVGGIASRAGVGVLGLVIGFAAGTTGSAQVDPAGPQAPAVEPHRSRIEALSKRAAERPTAEPAEPAGCGDPEAWCAMRMHLSGCSPLDRPDDFEALYDADAVEAWVEDMERSCKSFREEVLHVDCSAIPCLLMVEAEAGGDADGPEGVRWVDDEPYLDDLVCGGQDGPALHVHGRAHHDVPVDVLVVWPELELDGDVWHRVRLRGDAYEKTELQDMLEAHRSR